MTPTPTEIADSLRPCPFCGKADPRIYDGEGEFELDPMQWQIVCDVNNGGCGGSAKWSFTQADAIAAWNRRATSRGHRAAAEEIADWMDENMRAMGGSKTRDIIATILSRRFPRTEISRALGGTVGDRYAEGYAAALAVTLNACNDLYDRHACAAKIDGPAAWKSACDQMCDAIRALKPQGGEE